MQNKYPTQSFQLDKIEIEGIKKQFSFQQTKQESNAQIAKEISAGDILAAFQKQHSSIQLTSNSSQQYAPFNFNQKPSLLQNMTLTTDTNSPSTSYTSNMNQSNVKNSQFQFSFFKQQDVKQNDQTSAIRRFEKKEVQIEERIDRFNGTQEQKRVLRQNLQSFQQMIKVALDLNNKRVQEIDSNQEGQEVIIQKVEDKIEQVLDGLQESNNYDQANKDINKQYNVLMKVVQSLQQNLQQHEKQIKQLNQIIIDSKIDQKAEVNRNFLELEQSNPELFLYCKTFYWSTLNTLNAYRIVGTGVVLGNHKSKMNELLGNNKEIISKCVNKGVEMVSKYLDPGVKIAKGVLKSIPFVGSLVSGIDDVVSSILSAINFTQNLKELSQFEQRVSSINKVILSKFNTDEQISLTLAKVAIKLTSLKKEIILQGPNPLLPSTSYSWFEEKIISLKQSAIQQVEISGNDVGVQSVMLAIRDVSLFISYISQNANEIVNNKENSIDELMLDIIQNKSLDKLVKDKTKSLLLKEKKQIKLDNKQKNKSKNCSIF